MIGGGAAMTLDEDVVEVAGLLGGELAQPEVVEDEEVGGEPGAQFALEGVVGARLAQGEQELGDLDEADVMAGAAGAVAEGLGEPALADADRAAEDDVLLGGEPVEGEELADARAVVAHGRVPHELLVADELLEAGGREAAGEAVAVAAIDLVLEQELEELEGRELGLARVGGAIGERGQQAAQAQALEAADQIRGDLHRRPPRLGGVMGKALGGPGEAAGSGRTAPRSAGPGSRSSAAREDLLDAADIEQLEGEGARAGGIHAGGAVALGQPQQLLRLAQARPGEGAAQQHARRTGRRRARPARPGGCRRRARASRTGRARPGSRCSRWRARPAAGARWTLISSPWW